MSWQPEVDEVKQRVELAKQMGGEANVARQHANGRLTVRERIDRLLDAGSFHETGALAGKAVYADGEMKSFTPSNFVCGMGRIDGRRVAVGGDDFTVRGGAADAAIGHKRKPSASRRSLTRATRGRCCAIGSSWRISYCPLDSASSGAE